MGRNMHCWFYGHWGAPVLVFPSAAGFAHEWELHSMIDALSGLINGGHIKLYTVESNVSKTLADKHSPPADRMARFLAYEAFVLEDMVAAIREDCGSPDIRVAVTGTSLGAFHAATFALKHPEVFHYALCLSGRYELNGFVSGYSHDVMYFNNPMAFVPGLEGDALERVCSNTHLTLVCGQGPWEEGNIEETRALAGLLDAKGISHFCDMWGHDVAHEWVWWKRQALHHLSMTFR
jgi:esterase/lipase superfamily enzyme